MLVSTLVGSVVETGKSVKIELALKLWKRKSTKEKRLLAVVSKFQKRNNIDAST